MTTGQGPTTVLQHKYIAQSGREQGSISASVFTSTTGEPAGRWRAAPVYQPAEVIEQKPDGQQYSRYEGYIESKPGVYFGIVLQWRSKNGALTKTWKLDDDLVAYYYLDGRPLPCMRYGGKNPLPLSGLWPDNDTRYPLKWEERQSTLDNLELTDDLFASSEEHNPVIPPVFSADDLSSIRITLHHKSDEEGSRYKKFEDSPMPGNVNLKRGMDMKLFKNKHLTESVGLQAPDHVSEIQLEEIFSGREAPAKSLPFLEFRIYYKDRATLQRLDIMPTTSPDDLPAERPIASSSRQTNGTSAAESSQSRTVYTNGHNGSSSHTSKRPRQSDVPASTGVNGNHPTRNGDGSRSASPLPPPLASRPSGAPSSTVPSAPSTSRSMPRGDIPPPSTSRSMPRGDIPPPSTSRSMPRGDIPPPSKRIKPEPHSSPNRMKVDSQANPLSAEQSDAIMTPEDESQLDFPPAAQGEQEQAEEQEEQEQEQAGQSRGFSPPPVQDADSQPSSASEFFNAPSAPDAPAQPVEERRPTPSTSTSASVPSQPAKAEAPSPRLPSIAQRTMGVKLDSPMPSMSQSQSQNSFFGNASQSQNAAQEARELEAEAFLNEDALDIAEPENVQALLSVGFRTKKKFLSRLPHCDQTTRDRIFAELESQMEALDYGVLRAYLLKHCEL